ncbi:hypothetical protein [Nonomuraea africana]|uniref:hypothetical protein n=1 Tax=Nonomuraea africana TaxID=46171 RepID=UPI0031E3DAD3
MSAPVADRAQPFTVPQRAEKLLSEALERVSRVEARVAELEARLGLEVEVRTYDGSVRTYHLPGVREERAGSWAAAEPAEHPPQGGAAGGEPAEERGRPR